MAHDPICGFNRPSGEFDFTADNCARCEFIAKVRADERFSTVEGAVVIASQSGAGPELVQLLSSMYESREAPWTDGQRREAAAELTRLAQELGLHTANPTLSDYQGSPGR